MKSRKLMNLGRRKALAPTLAWLESAATTVQPESGAKAELLTVPYPQWTETLKIKTPNGVRPFELYDWQLGTAEKLLGGPGLPAAKGRQIVLLSSRQTGKTSMLLTMTDYMARARQQLTAIMIHRTGDDAHDLCRRLKRFVGSGDFSTDNLGLLEYKATGSVCYFRSGNPNRGEEGAIRAGQGISSADWVVIEESQDFANIESVIGMVGPAATHGNPKLFILVGTAGSKLSYFYQQLSKAAGSSEVLEAILSGIRAGTSEPFQILDSGEGPIGIISNWRCIPEFAAEPDFLGRIQQELGLSDADIAKHYEMNFDAGTDSAVFDYGLVMSAQVPPTPYEHSVSDVLYIGVDPAGAGKDFAVAIALHEVEEGDHSIYKVVSLYRKRTGTSEQHLSAVDRMISGFNPLETCVETNSMGQVWLEHLVGRGHSYPIIGVATTAKTKPVLISRIILALERGILQIPSDSPIIGELLAYRRLDNGKMEAGGGAHDDCVIALAMALQATGFNAHG